jgi:hypothetical protein
MAHLLAKKHIQNSLRKKLHTSHRVIENARSVSIISTQRSKRNFENVNSSIRKSTVSFSSQSLQERGIYDESNLLKFNTLHELQSNASIAFADNPLFGTYTEKEEKEPYFDYMTYSEFGAKVDTCRALLHDLGMSMFLLM